MRIFENILEYYFIKQINKALHTNLTVNGVHVSMLIILQIVELG